MTDARGGVDGAAIFTLYSSAYRHKVQPEYLAPPYTTLMRLPMDLLMKNLAASREVSNPNPATSFAASGGEFDPKGLT